MGNFRAELVAHSINEVGDEAITFSLCYERAIHAEYMTHRWSRNASSSRAIPIKRMIEWTRQDPAMPLHMGCNKAGMQAGEEIALKELATLAILKLFDDNASFVENASDVFGLHKEVLNRYIEAWGWINVVMTVGRPQLMNAFCLRCTPDATPNIQRLFVNMARKYRSSTPKLLRAGEWHLPFVTDDEVQIYLEQQGIEPDPLNMPYGLLVWSAARCAWTSYKTVDNKEATWERAKKRHDELIRYGHCTPLEHQLRARADHGRNGGCVAGFDCYRHMMDGESASEFDFTILDTLYGDRDFVISQ